MRSDEVGSLPTLAVLGPESRRVATRLPVTSSYVWIASADTLTQLVTSRAFPSTILITDQAGSIEATIARIKVARQLGARVLLITRDRAATSRTWPADETVPSDAGIDQLATSISCLLSSSSPRHETLARVSSMTSREREALLLWAHHESVASIADQMEVSNATASTFLWRARRKLSQGARL
jgi:DNA-binding CsgD family transcriptional regulator